MLTVIAVAAIGTAFLGLIEGGLLGALTGLVAPFGIGTGIGIALGDKMAKLDEDKTLRFIQRLGGILVAMLCSWAAMRGGWTWGWLWVPGAYLGALVVVLIMSSIAMGSGRVRS